VGQGAAAVRTEGLGKRFGRATALADLSIEVPRGEIFALLGPNGAGKTTAVRLLLGLTAPSAGAGWVLDRPLGSREARRRTGYMPELFRHPPWLTGREVLFAHAALAGIARERRAGEVETVLATVNLERRADEAVATYSKGMQQRLALAAALIGEPDLVVLDEPTSALDPVGRRDVREVIRALKARGTAVVLNSHLLSEVEAVCDRVAVLRGGRVIAQGTLGALRGRPEVYIRLDPADTAGEGALAAFGAVRREGEWRVVEVADTERVPEIVAAVVGAGGRVHAVDVRQGSLEERLIDLLRAAPT
jgi:ABC-2 type transport system ATP-binding protein